MQPPQCRDHIGSQPHGEQFGNVGPHWIEEVVEMGVFARSIFVRGDIVEAGGGDVSIFYGGFEEETRC